MGLIADIHRDLEFGALQLIVEYRARLHVEAVKLCGDETQADDLVFRTFEQVLAKVDSYKVDTNLFGWMKSIMENIHLNDVRRPVDRRTKAVPPEELEQCAGADWSTDEQLLKNSDSEALREALHGLDPKYHKVLLMRYYQELSMRQIAEILRLPLGTVTRRVQIAHELLAGKLRAEFGKAKKPLAVLLAALFGAGALFGAWQAGLLAPFLQRSGEAESFPLQDETFQRGEADQSKEATKSGESNQRGEAYPPSEASCEAGAMRGESFPLHGGTVSTQLQSQSETGLTQEEAQSETTKEQTMNMKTVKALAASAVAAIAGAVSGTTYNVPADGTLNEVVPMAQSGDEVVIAASETPYVLTAALTVPAGVTVRGATGDWKDVVVSGGDAVGGFTLSAGSAVSNLTITACICGAEGTAGAKVAKDSTLANCRVTACHATANRANGIGVNNAGTVRGCLIDGNYAPDTFTGNRGVGLYTSGSAALTEDTVIVGNWAAWLNTGNDTWTGHGAAGVRAGGGTFRRCYVGANSVGVVTVGSVTVGSGFFATGAVTIENCTIEGNTYDGPELETVPGLSMGNANSTMKNTVILNNRHVDGVKNNAYIPSSYADSKYENNASDGVIAGYAGEKVAIVVTEDDFVRIDGLLRPKPGSMASGLGALPDWDGVTPADPVHVPVTNLVSDISLLQSAIDAAEPGDVVLIAKGNYTVTETIMVKDGVTVAGATGNRGDVVLDGNNAVRIANVTGATLKNVTLSRGYVKNTQTCGAGAQLGRGGCLENCRVTGVTTINHMYATGMAVYNAGGRVRGCLIDGNSSAGSTYTSVAYYQSSGMIDRSVIRDNTCVSTSLSNGNFPGVVGCQITSGVIRNCVITGNSPGNVTGASFVTGCGVRLTGSGTQMINCLVYGNTYYGTQSANLQGVGITDSNATVLNSVILGNGYRDNPVQNFTGAARHKNNVTDKATADLCTASFEGTVEGLFVKSGDDYDIKAGGALVDAGTAQPVAEQGLDFYGRPRLGGERIDIGPFEYHVPPFAVTFESPVYFALDRIETTLTATASGDTAGTVYSWFLNDAETPFATGADKQVVPFVLTELGTHTVTLRAVNGAGLADEFTQTYRVQQGTFVVNPGESIPDAIAVAEPGSTVLLKAGIHTNAATISVNKAITVRGESREGAVLYCGGTARGFVLSESGAVLADLTVSDAYGNAWKGVGVGVVLNTGTLMTNCVVRNCKSGNTDYGVGVYCSSARIVDSVITNCTGGCGTGVYMTGANSLVYRTLVRGNSCGYYASYPLAGGIYAGGGTVRGSVIADNSFRISKWTQAYADASVLASGVRLDGSRLENCTVVGNVQTTPADQPEYDGLIGGVAAGGSACAVNSCLIAGNIGNDGVTADNALEKTYLSGYTTCCTSAIENFPEGNKSSEPGPVYRYSKRRGEYRLTQGSPCAGAGTWQTWMAGERDIYGRAWNPDRVDIGAAVYDCKGLMLMLK